MAVKIFIKRKFKDGSRQEASRFVINNRTGAMNQPGYINSETLQSLDDRNQVLVVSMWENMEAWEAWKNSETRKANVKKFQEYMVGETVYEHYSLGLPFE
ncbi:MAG: antibiotic biosynthesis monooxygenase [Desulfobacterales bacterium]|jgi:heme-degrading monooxygenase HmoA